MEPDKYKRPEPEEPEHFDCCVCLKEIPSSTGHTVEGEEYVLHFCGADCLEEWKRKGKSIDHPGEL